MRWFPKDKTLYHEWFAWHPVTVYTLSGDYYVKQRVWLEYVKRAWRPDDSRWSYLECDSTNL